MPASSRLRAVLLASAVAALVAVVGLSPAPAQGRSTGANPGFAGDRTLSSGAPQTCAVCHNSFEIDDASNSLTLDVAPTATPGATVPITITLDNKTTPAAPGSGRQGFEVTVRDPASGELWGRLLLADANTQYAGQGASRDTAYVTHTLGGTAQSTWTVDWAPGTERSGTARVYVAANAADGNGTTSGDSIHVATADVVVPDVSTPPSPRAEFAISAPRPNPTRAGRPARLGLTMRQAGRVRVTVVDGLGRAVRPTQGVSRAAGESSVEVETVGLAAGLYFIVVEGPGGRQTQPVAVVR